MKKILSHIHLPIFISGSVIILITGVIAIWTLSYPGQVQAVWSTIASPFQKVDFVNESSSVELYREHDQLKLNFLINEKDQGDFAKLSEQLGISTDWQKGISFGLDQQTLESLEANLPAKATIKVEGKKVILEGSALSFLQAGISGDQFEYATGSAVLRYSTDQQGVHLIIEQPGELVAEATKSGMMNVSKKIEEELFSLGAKIDTIDLELKGKSLEGGIILK